MTKSAVVKKRGSANLESVAYSPQVGPSQNDESL